MWEWAWRQLAPGQSAAGLPATPNHLTVHIPQLTYWSWWSSTTNPHPSSLSCSDQWTGNNLSFRTFSFLSFLLTSFLSFFFYPSNIVLAFSSPYSRLSFLHPVSILYSPIPPVFIKDLDIEIPHFLICFIFDKETSNEHCLPLFFPRLFFLFFVVGFFLVQAEDLIKLRNVERFFFALHLGKHLMDYGSEYLSWQTDTDWNLINRQFWAD